METFDINDVEIFAAGEWNGDHYTTKDLDTLVESFNKTKESLKPYLKLGHSDQQKLLAEDELPAAGWIANLRRIGEKLVADFVGVPKKIYELIKQGGYKRISSEIYINPKIAGQIYDKALKAVALLGGATPAVSNLKDIMALYGMQAITLGLDPNTGAQFKTYDYDVVEEKDYHIVQRGSKWCLISKSTGETLGCHPTREGALQQEQAIKSKETMDHPKMMPEMPKNGVKMPYSIANGIATITIEQMKEICPDCSENMQEKHMREIRFDMKKPLRYQMSPEAMQGLCDKFGDPTGFRTRCMDSSVGDSMGDVGAFCNWLKEQCHGSVAETTKKGEVKQMEEMQKQLAEAQLKIKELELENKKLQDDQSLLVKKHESSEVKVKEYEAKLRHQEISAKIDDLIKQKKIVPAQKEVLFALLVNVPETKERKFKAGEKEYSSVEELVLAFASSNASIGFNDSPQSERGKKFSDPDAKRDENGNLVRGEADARKIQEYATRKSLSFKEATLQLAAAGELESL